jgi:hypothetical protein
MLEDRARVADLEDGERLKDPPALGDNEPPRAKENHSTRGENESENAVRDELGRIVRDLERLSDRPLTPKTRADLAEAFCVNDDRIRAWHGALLAAPPESRNVHAWIERASWEPGGVEVNPDGSLEELPGGLSEEWPAETYLHALKRPDLAARFANPATPEPDWVEELREEQRPEPEPDPVPF